MSKSETGDYSRRIPLPPRNCPCCNSPSFVIEQNHLFRVECKSCGLATRWSASKDTPLWVWSKRFDGQYGITARELEAAVVTRLRGWFDHQQLAYPPFLQNPERYPLDQVVTGCCSSLNLLTDNAEQADQ